MRRPGFTSSRLSLAALGNAFRRWTGLAPGDGLSTRDRPGRVPWRASGWPWASIATWWAWAPRPGGWGWSRSSGAGATGGSRGSPSRLWKHPPAFTMEGSRFPPRSLPWRSGSIPSTGSGSSTSAGTWSTRPRRLLSRDLLLGAILCVVLERFKGTPRGTVAALMCFRPPVSRGSSTLVGVLGTWSAALEIPVHRLRARPPVAPGGVPGAGGRASRVLPGASSTGSWGASATLGPVDARLGARRDQFPAGVCPGGRVRGPGASGPAPDGTGRSSIGRGTGSSWSGSWWSSRWPTTSSRSGPPVQPIHFTQGYDWIPLFLLGLPTIVGLLDRPLRAPRRRPLRLALGRGPRRARLFLGGQRPLGSPTSPEIKAASREARATTSTSRRDERGRDGDPQRGSEGDPGIA